MLPSVDCSSFCYRYCRMTGFTKVGRWSFYYGWLLFIPLAGAATVGMETDIAPQTWGWGLALYGYVVGISLYAKNESINKEEPHRVAIFLLFLPSLCALGGLVLWNNLDPIRVFFWLMYPAYWSDG